MKKVKGEMKSSLRIEILINNSVCVWLLYACFTSLDTIKETETLFVLYALPVDLYTFCLNCLLNETSVGFPFIA